MAKGGREGETGAVVGGRTREGEDKGGKAYAKSQGRVCITDAVVNVTRCSLVTEPRGTLRNIARGEEKRRRSRRIGGGGKEGAEQWWGLGGGMA